MCCCCRDSGGGFCCPQWPDRCCLCFSKRVGAVLTGMYCIIANLAVLLPCVYALIRPKFWTDGKKKSVVVKRSIQSSTCKLDSFGSLGGRKKRRFRARGGERKKSALCLPLAIPSLAPSVPENVRSSHAPQSCATC